MIKTTSGLYLSGHAITHTPAHHAVDQGQSHGKHQCLHAKDSPREKGERRNDQWFGGRQRKAWYHGSPGTEFQEKETEEAQQEL